MRDPTVGDKVDQYELTDMLARSGMASIFRATDTETGAPVALKIPHVQYESDVVFSERFRREEEAGQELSHPNIVRILKPKAKTRTYMAMELVEGKSLRALMGKTPMPVDQALDIVRQLCSALEYLHQQGVVHRDIKPENLLVTADGTVKILDFGIALFAGERRLTWTGLSNTIGTPDYMAPEQIRGRRGDQRTDIYAAGTILYELLTCNLPYDSANPRVLMKAKTTDEPRAPTCDVPDFDPHLEAIILKAIERDPRDRYLTAAEMLRDLENPSAVPPRDPSLVRASERGGLPRRLLLALVVAAIITGLGALIAFTGRRAPPPNVIPGATGRNR